MRISRRDFFKIGGGAAIGFAAGAFAFRETPPRKILLRNFKNQNVRIRFEVSSPQERFAGRVATFGLSRIFLSKSE